MCLEGDGMGYSQGGSDTQPLALPGRATAFPFPVANGVSGTP